MPLFTVKETRLVRKIEQFEVEAVTADEAINKVASYDDDVATVDFELEDLTEGEASPQYEVLDGPDRE